MPAGRIRRMVVLVEHFDGDRSAWQVEHGMLTIEAVFEDCWKPGDGPLSARDDMVPFRGTLQASGFYSALIVPADMYGDAGFTAGEIGEERALPAPQRAMEAGGS